MKISATWEEGGSKTPASPARVVQYEGASIISDVEYEGFIIYFYYFHDFKVLCDGNVW